MKLPIYTCRFRFIFIFSCVGFDYSKIPSHKFYVNKKRDVPVFLIIIFCAISNFLHGPGYSYMDPDPTFNALATVDLLGKLSIFFWENNMPSI